MAIRNFSNIAPPLTLAIAISNSGTLLTVSSTSGYPDAPFLIGLERGTANEEIVLCTAKSATTFTVTRGYDDTVAVAHVVGSTVEHTSAAIEFREANEHVNDLANPHALTYSQLGAHTPAFHDNMSFEAWKTGVQNINADASTAVTFVEQSDDDGVFDAVESAFVPDTSAKLGWWLFVVNLVFEEDATSFREALLLRDTTEIGGDSKPAAAVGETVCSFSVLRRVTTLSQSYKVFAQHGVSGGLDLLGTEAVSFAGFKMGDL